MNAQVLFSEGLALSFSKEVKNISIHTDDSDSDEYGDYCRECFECPTLTVRVVNENGELSALCNKMSMALIHITYKVLLLSICQTA